MNNLIVYFYGINVDEIKNHNNKYYSFVYNEELYKLYLVDRGININQMVNINKELVGRTLVSKIIVNKNNEAVSLYDNNLYILMKVYASDDGDIKLDEINHLAKSLYSNAYSNWGMLWSKKVDYLEKLINQFGKQYPLMVESFNYFVGMAENAISYYNNIDIGNKTLVVSHKTIGINDKRDMLYNPLNIIFDYKVRDIAEYFKNAFFLNKKDIFSEFSNYVKNNNLSVVDIKLLVARLMYPSFYFRLYEDILIDKVDEKIILSITGRIDEYEKYLAKLIDYLSRWYDIDKIRWLEH